MQDKGHCHKGELEGVCRMLSADSKLNIPSRPHWLPLGVTKLCHKPSLPRKRRVRNSPSSENSQILQVRPWHSECRVRDVRVAGQASAVTQAGF
jgi:hypothetical protein